MASEPQDSIENDDKTSKEEHIKQRLKDMGVSEDSERPEKSFVSKYGKYFMLVILVGLIAAYGIEYSKQVDTEEEQVADTTTNTNAMSQHAPGYGQPMMQPPAWVQERRAQMQQPPEPPAWVQERRAQMQQPPEPPAWVQERRAQIQQPPEPPQWVKDRQAQMQQPPEPPAWVQERRRMWMQQQQAQNKAANSQQQNAQGYPVYPPHPYWQTNPGYYPNNAYGQWPAYPGPYAGSYPYYNGW